MPACRFKHDYPASENAKTIQPRLYKKRETRHNGQAWCEASHVRYMLKEFKTLLPYFKKYALYYLGGFFFLFITDGGQLIIPQILKIAIDTISASRFSQGRMLTYALYIGGAALATAIARFWWRFFFHGVSFKIVISFMLIFLRFLPPSMDKPGLGN